MISLRKNPTELLFNIGKANIITTTYLLKGYRAIPLKRESQDLACFKTHSVQYRFKVMPFGLHNAAATFQREMIRALSKYKNFAGVYIDDISVYSEMWAEHLMHLEAFSKLLELQFLVSLKKCAFAISHIKHLRHVVVSSTHQTNPDKVDTILKLAIPQTKKQLKSVLGLCNYYLDYLPNNVETA